MWSIQLGIPHEFHKFVSIITWKKKHTADAVENSMHNKSIRVKLSKHSFSGQFSTKILEPQTLKTSP